MLRVGAISVDTKWNTNGVNFYLLMIDAEERKWEQGIGLDTQLPLTVNDEW